VTVTHQLGEHTFRQHRIRQVEPCKFVLVRL
jgi:hypothetical protein